MIRVRLLIPLAGIAVGALVALAPGWSPAGGVPAADLIGARAVRLPGGLDGSAVTAIAFTADGQVVAGTATGTVELRDANGAAAPAHARKVAASPIVQVASSRDGLTVAAATIRSVYVLSRPGLEVRDRIEVSGPDEAGIRSLALDAYGRLLAVGRLDVAVYDLGTGRRAITLTAPPSGRHEQRGEYESLAFTPDTATLYASDTFRTETWSVQGWKARSSFRCGCFHPLRWSATARWAGFGTADGHVLIRDGARGMTTRDVTAAPAPGSYIGDTAINDDASMLLAGLNTGEVLAWTRDRDVPAGRIRVGTGEIALLRLSPNGRRLIIGERTERFMEQAQAYHQNLWMVTVNSA
ncbi:hypothetical protein GCM10022226_43920 [Sphaerisporangium flaviroseum]|uniref:WD40 repeat domain-containing protein n=1 Tax=Sphaerisporangium flaviroseum TaxID=509199 RepID=A0ABP7IHL7_9ACTN